MTTYPPVVQAALRSMDETQKLAFESEYTHRAKGKVLLIILAIAFPIQMFILGRVGLGIIFWLTVGGLGVWWLIEIFYTSRRVDDYNARHATDIARDLKIMT